MKIRAYIQGPPLWYDELALSYDIINSHSLVDFFKPLEFLQVAPPIYLCMVKLIIKIAGINVYSLRFIPLITGCASLIIFSVLLNKIFNNKIAILTGLFLFAFNGPLIYYCKEAKPYMTDVFWVLLLVFIYSKIDFTEKNMVLYSILFLITPFCSFPALIPLASIAILEFFRKKRNKQNILLFFILLFDLGILFLIEHGQYSGMIECTDWFESFFSPSIKSFFDINMIFFSYMGYNSVIAFILFIIGLLFTIFQKDNLKIYSLIILLAYLASFLHIYPFTGRAILFLIPIFIIFIVNVLEKLNNLKIPFIVYLISNLLIISIFLHSIGIVNNLKLVTDKDYYIMDSIKQQREMKKEYILTFLDKYKDYARIIMSEELTNIHLFYYSDMNNYNHEFNVIMMSIDADLIKTEFENNGSKDVWIAGIIDEAPIENLLNELDIKYEKFIVGDYKLYHTLS